MLDEIVSIECIGNMEMLDIEVSGNHLFYANDILTHNSTSDMDLTNTSESMGLVHTVDLMLALISTEELEGMGQIMIKQLKNRHGDLNNHRRFVAGIDRSKMKLYDVDDKQQEDVHESGFEKTDNPKKDFSGIRF